MSQPVKLSDQLVLDARLTGQVLERSIAGQIEFWANLGRALEPLLEGIHALALQRSVKTESVSSRLQSVDTAEGKGRVVQYLRSQPFPRYEPAAKQPGLLVRIGADGVRTTGRFVDRQFKAVKTSR